MHASDAVVAFNAIATLAAMYIQSKNDADDDAAPSPPPLHLDELIKRPTVSPKDWLGAMCTTPQVDPRAIIEYTSGDVYVPGVEELRNIPRVFNTVSLLNSQLAIIMSLVHAPTRRVSVFGRQDGTAKLLARNACSVPVGMRPVIRLNFSPAGTGKTLMSLVSAVAFVKEHHSTYCMDDLWRADLFGCIATVKPIAPLVFCVVSNTVHTQWKEAAHLCAQAFGDDGYDVCAFPKAAASTVKTATVIDAVDAIGMAGGAVIYVVSSAYAQQALDSLPFSPTAFLMDEISHDACNVKYVPLPLTLLITASPRSVAASLINKRRDTMLRTIFGDGTASTIVRIAACNTAEPYYAALAAEAAQSMPPMMHFCELTVLFNRRSNLTIVPTMDPCQFVTRDELCRLLDIDPQNKITLRDLLSAQGRDPRNRMGTFNMELFKRRFTENGQNECICCRLEVNLQSADGAGSSTLDGEDYSLRAGNVIVTPCCSTMVCETCMQHLPMPKKCPQCSQHLARLGLPLIFSASPDTAALERPHPTVPDPTSPSELLARVKQMPVQDRPCVQVIEDLLSYATSAGIKRTFVSWSSTDETLARALEHPSREVYTLLGPASMERPLKRRKLNDQWIARYAVAPDGGSSDKMMALVANSTDMGSDQQIAGLNLAGTELVLVAGGYDRAQIISRAMRMSVSNQKPVIVVNINRKPAST
jgi:hypothetical protein